MAVSLIQLEDGTLVEVEALGGRIERTSGVTAFKQVEGTLGQVEGVLKDVCRPVVAAWRELNKEMAIAETEIELGLSFEGEGNVYLIKGKACANLTIKMLLKPPEDARVAGS